MQGKNCKMGAERGKKKDLRRSSPLHVDFKDPNIYLPHGALLIMHAPQKKSLPRAVAFSPASLARRCMAVGAMQMGLLTVWPRRVVWVSTLETSLRIRGRSRILIGSG